MVAIAYCATICGSDPRRRRTGRTVRRYVDGRVVDAEASLNVPRSDFRVPTFYVHRASLPLRLLVPRRRLAPRAARAHRLTARLPRARAHRPQRAVRIDGVRAGVETARAPGDHRRGADPARRFPRDPSRGNA